MSCITSRLPVSNARCSRIFLQSPAKTFCFSHEVSHRSQTVKSSRQYHGTTLLNSKLRVAKSWRGWSLSLLAGVGVVSSIITKKSLRLEGYNPEERPGAEDTDQRYLPVIPPCTISQANETLRWEESTQTCGMGSGVLRFDRVRLPSNLPCEDEMFSAYGYEDNEIMWLLWGVFDGHASVGPIT